MIAKGLQLVWLVAMVMPLSTVHAPIPQDPHIGLEDSAFLRGQPFHSITLEMSLKPFKKNDADYIRGICRELFTQWAPLVRHAEQVSVMMWTADGSEILSYTGDLAQRLEWAMYLGNPNTEHPVGSEPDAPLSIHQRAFLYMENPPEYTLQDLRLIVQCLKEEGHRITGKPVRVGATFDPGPEFAKSEFKYGKHPEICMSATMGAKSFVCCYAVARSNNGFYFSGYTPDTTVTQRLRFPQGAPLLLGYETLLENGCSTYHLPRGWHRECRVLVSQPADGRIGCNERHSNEKGVVRRLEVDGLADAKVIFFPGREAREENIRVYLNANYPWVQGRTAFEKAPAALGKCYQVTHVTGRLTIAW